MHCAELLLVHASLQTTKGVKVCLKRTGVSSAEKKQPPNGGLKSPEDVVG